MIDVRENGGEYMEKACKIADEFLQKNKLINVVKKGKIDKIVWTKKGNFATGKVAVLIDKNSA